MSALDGIACPAFTAGRAFKLALDGGTVGMCHRFHVGTLLELLLVWPCAKT
jgi:hypothetical protein